jgi:hypothetical protein
MTKILPPDPESMNDDRAEWAAAALTEFQRVTGTEDEDALGDLLTDLMHWADRNDRVLTGLLRTEQPFDERDRSLTSGRFCTNTQLPKSSR